MKKSIVGVVRASSYNVEYLTKRIQKVVEYIGGCNEVGNYDKIVIKINMCDAREPNTGAITHPKFLEAVLRWIREENRGAEVFVVESDATRTLADLYIRWFGYLKIMEKYRAKWVNLTEAPKKRERFKKLKIFREFDVPEVFYDAFFITLPKLKTNILSDITCCLKNQYGCLPIVNKDIYHRVLSRAIAELNVIFRPSLCIVDGIIAMGGAQGPAFGVPIPAKIIICGRDPVAVDAFAAKYIGFNPRKVKHIKVAAKLGVGSLKYRVVGEKIRKINFENRRWEFIAFKLGIKRQLRAWSAYRYSWRGRR